MGFKLHSTEKINNNSEEGYKIQTTRCFFFKKKIDVKVGKKKDWLTRLPSKRDTKEKPSKNNFGRFIGQRRVGALLPKERSVIALCASLWGSFGALLKLGQGRQGLKLPKMSRNQKIAIQFRQLC